MTDQQDLDTVMRKIESALRMADHAGSNENEAANAMALAQRLADAYNIDIAMARMSSAKVKGTADKAAPREDNLFNGGLYPYQRKLFEAVAQLNHCLYWAKKGLRKGERYQHRLVGSKINILLTKQMADYLQKTVERLARDWVNNDPKQYFTRAAHTFREGAVDRILETIRAERNARKAEDDRREAEEKARRSHPSYSGNAIVVMDDVRRAEEAANYDFQYGEGAWERRMQRQAEYETRVAEAAAARAKAEEEYRIWAEANPEEHARKQAELWNAKAKQEEEDRKYYEKLAKREAYNASRRVGSYRPSKRDNKDWGAYSAGNSAASSVRLDPQVNKDSAKQLS